MLNRLPVVVLGLVCACCVVTNAEPNVPQQPTTQPSTRPAGAEKVGVEKFDEMRSKPDVVILDVRMPGEFESGHLPGAVNLPWGGYFAEAFDAGAKKLDPSKTYLIHCASGKRSALAGKRLAELGVTRLYDLDGGIMAWKKAGKPVEK